MTEKYKIFKPNIRFTKSYSEHLSNIKILAGGQKNISNFSLTWDEKCKLYPSSCYYNNFNLNRYPDVLVNDQNRVILCDAPQSTSQNLETAVSTSFTVDPIVKNIPVGYGYINASWIVDHVTDIKVIATQAPLPSTVSHFFQMIWENKCPCIFTLGQIYEATRQKMYQYWPVNIGSQTFTNCKQYAIKLLEVENYEIYIVRVFSISHGNETRVIYQLHLENWPDHQGTDPKNIIAILEKWNKIKKMATNNKLSNIPVVHCSAGIGRTGTLIAVYLAICRINQYIQPVISKLYLEKIVDPNGIIDMVRIQRHKSIQKKDQYNMIFKCLNHYVEKNYPTINFTD